MNHSLKGLGMMQCDISKARSIFLSLLHDQNDVDANIDVQYPYPTLRIPTKYLEQCYGVCVLFYMCQSSWLWSGSLATGFVMFKLHRGTSRQRWSAPSAIIATPTTDGDHGNRGDLHGFQPQPHAFQVIFLRDANAARAFMSKAKVDLEGNDICAESELGSCPGSSSGSISLGRNEASSMSIQVEPTTTTTTTTTATTTTTTFSTTSTNFTSDSSSYFVGPTWGNAVFTCNHPGNQRFYGRHVHAQDLLIGNDGLDAWEFSPQLADLYVLLDSAMSRNNTNRNSHYNNYGVQGAQLEQVAHPRSDTTPWLEFASVHEKACSE